MPKSKASPEWTDFRRLWGAFTVSEVGSAIGAGALPLIAITMLHVAAWQVTLMAALGGVVAAVVALPLGPVVEFRQKRPVMITADLARFVILGSVPIAAVLGRLTFAHLCLAQMSVTVGAIAFSAASAANLKNLLPMKILTIANSRFETTYWTASTLGPPIGGVLISMVGSTITVALDALSFLASAIGVSTLRTPEPAAPSRTPEHRWRVEIGQGWRHIGKVPDLRALFLNAMLFGGGLLMITAIMPLFMLRDLGLTPWQYGLALGLPGLGGVIGAACSPLAVRQTSERTILLAFGAARTFWAGLLPFAPHGTPGLLVIVLADTLLLFCAGVFNPVFTTYRMRATPNHVMSRVSTAWSVSAKSCQALGMIIGGIVATTLGVRASLLAGAALILFASLTLPWRPKAASIPECTRGLDSMSMTASQRKRGTPRT